MNYFESLSANDLTEWIGLFLPDLAPDGAGGFIETPPANVEEDRPAKVSFNSGRKTYAEGQNADRYEFSVTIRYEPGITTAYRLSWRSAYYSVVTVENMDTLDEWLRLTVVKREAGAQ